MYQVRVKDWSIIGVDENNNRKILFDTGRFLDNKSRVRVHHLERDEDGNYASVVEWADTVCKRLDEIPKTMKDGIQEFIWTVTECRIIDRLLKKAAPVMIAFIDIDEYAANRYEHVVDMFRNSHEVYRISSDKSRGFQSQGFDIVIVNGDDKIAETQIKLASKLVSEDGVLLCSARNTLLFQQLLNLVAKPKDEYCISQYCSVIDVNGSDINRDLVLPMDLNKAYNDCCARTSRILNNDSPVLELRRICVELKELAKEAQNQWNLPMKQQFLDLKEAIQSYFLNIGDKYEDYYRSELEEIIKM